MTVSTFCTRAAHLARTALGAALGLSLAGAVVFQPAQAFAQAVEAAPAPVAAARVVPQAVVGRSTWTVPNR